MGSAEDRVEIEEIGFGRRMSSAWMRGDLLKIKQKLTNGGIAHDF